MLKELFHIQQAIDKAVTDEKRKFGWDLTNLAYIWCANAECQRLEKQKHHFPFWDQVNSEWMFELGTHIASMVVAVTTTKKGFPLES